jgi:hypothetical protein
MDGAPKGSLGVRAEPLELPHITLQMVYVGIDIKDAGQGSRM